MNMFKLKLLTEDDVFQEIHVNPTMIGAVLPSPRDGLVRIVMSGGQVLDVEEDMEGILARLALS